MSEFIWYILIMIYEKNNVSEIIKIYKKETELGINDN